MASLARAAAARGNGTCSRGPVTVEGKARSALNSRRHGLCSRAFYLEDEVERREFEALLADVVFTQHAVGAAQLEVCRTLAVALWRQRVCDNLEAALFAAIGRGVACAEAGGDGLPSMRTLTRYRARLARDLKEAKANLADLKAARRQAFVSRIEIAREMREPTHLAALKETLGEEGFAQFRESVTNEPKTPENSGDRKARRRQKALARRPRKRS